MNSVLANFARLGVPSFVFVRTLVFLGCKIVLADRFLRRGCLQGWYCLGTAPHSHPVLRALWRRRGGEPVWEGAGHTAWFRAPNHPCTRQLRDPLCEQTEACSQQDKAVRMGFMLPRNMGTKAAS